MRMAKCGLITKSMIVCFDMKKLLILLFSILISFNSYGETICYESNSVQERNGLWYLPNQQESFTGDNLLFVTMI